MFERWTNAIHILTRNNLGAKLLWPEKNEKKEINLNFMWNEMGWINNNFPIDCWTTRILRLFSFVLSAVPTIDHSLYSCMRAHLYRNWVDTHKKLPIIIKLPLVFFPSFITNFNYEIEDKIIQIESEQYMLTSKNVFIFKIHWSVSPEHTQKTKLLYGAAYFHSLPNARVVGFRLKCRPNIYV